MALISLICLLALSSSAFGRSSYGSFQVAEPVRELNTQQRTVLTLPTTNTYSTGSYGSQGDFMGSRTLPLPEPVPEQKWTNAEMQCRGQRPGTIIPLDNGRRWISCLDEEKAVEQACPRNLFYNLESRRCERRAGALENPCVSQPCLNNGQCLPIDSSSFECKCGAGFDGTFCELDARVCHTQQPCGQAPGTRCQSFRSGAALQYVCIHQNEHAYGFNAQQIQSSPCQTVDGTHPLGISDKGFVMCDGERMFVESCPGGTIWEDTSKACVWPDMQGLFGIIRTVEPVKDYSYGQQKSVPTSSYTAPALPLPRTLEPASSYGQTTMQRSFEQTSLPIPPKQSYGAPQTFTKTFDSSVQQPTSSYGSQEQIQTQPIFQQPIQKSVEFFPVQQPTSSYGNQFQKQPEFRSFQKTSSY